MKITITGSRGFIGTHVRNSLQDHEIIEWDTKIDRDIKYFASESSIDDLRFSDFVIHLAGLTDVRESIKIPDEYWKNNVEYSKIIFDICSHVNFSKMSLYFKCMQENKINEGIEILFNLYHDGFSVMDILDSIFNYVKMEKVEIAEEIKYKLIKYLCKYITIFHEIHEEEIELALFTNNIIKLFKE